MVAGVADEREQGVEIPLQVVEEDAADAARLVAVRQEEILVAPLLEPMIIRDRRMTFTRMLEILRRLGG